MRRLRPRLRRLGSGFRALVTEPLSAAGISLIVLFGLGALTHPLLRATVWRHNMYNPVTGFDLSLAHPSSPSSVHLLGTDVLGRDVLSMVLAGARPAWVVALVAAFVTAGVALLVGVFGAGLGGKVDAVLSRVSDGFLLLPAPVFVLVISEQVDLEPLAFGLVYGLVTGLGAGAIVLRSQAIKVMAEPFVDAARVAGGRRAHIVVHHLIPHLIPLAALYMLLAVVGALVAYGFAAFLGQTARTANWGSMIYDGITFAGYGGHVPWNSLLTATGALSLFAAGFYLISAGIREITGLR